MTLDIPTLMVVASLTTVVCGSVLLIAQDSRTDNESLRTWGLSMLLGAMGLVIGVFASEMWTPELIGLGMVCTLLSRGMGWSGARRFAGKRPYVAVSFLGGGIWLVLLAALPTWLWMVTACMVAVGYLVAMMRELWPRSEEKLRSRSLLLGLLGIQIVIFIVRAGMVVPGGALGGVPGGLVAGGGLSADIRESVFKAVIVINILHTIGAAMLMLALVKEHVERRAVMQMREMAMIDSLTGINNRRFMDEQLPLELRRARRLNSSVALLLIDVDHFKKFNDDFGHPEGDACLRGIAGAIGQCIRRPGDLLARYGGEEFLVLLPNTTLEGATLVAETIRAAVIGLPWTPACPGKSVTVSIGVAALAPDGRDSEEVALIAAADRALYAAKAAGRNTVRDHMHAALAVAEAVS